MIITIGRVCNERNDSRNNAKKWKKFRSHSAKFYAKFRIFSRKFRQNIFGGKQFRESHYSVIAATINCATKLVKFSALILTF